MKTALHTLLLLVSVSGTALAGNFFGSSPFGNGAWFPGYLNGKYVAVVTPAKAGSVISGVIGFAITDGAPPFRITEEQSSAGGAIETVPLVNQQISPDVLQNYFAIFVEGRTYTGVTFAGIDIDSGNVAGALQGQNPVGLLGITASPTFAGAGQNATVDALSVVNRGLSGGFNASINSKKAVFTFSGTGDLSTPFDPQTITLDVVPTEADPILNPDVPAGTVISETITGRVTTASTPFNLSGIRTSFAANNPAALKDQIEFSAGQGGN